MKREIKFRAWIPNTGWLAEGFSIAMDGTEWYDDDGHSWPISDLEIMQFTGLKDKNGKEIYEGDIVQHGYKIHTGTFIYTGYVHYATDRAMFYITQLGKEQFSECAITHNNINGKGKIFEVIGNIYENPELLN